MLRKLLTIFFFATTLSVYAQSEYTSIYKIFNLPASARIAGLGGKSIAIPEPDINFAAATPSALTDTMSNQLALNVTNHLVGVNYGNFLWGYSLKHRGNIAIGMQYLNYGTIDRMDEFGYNQGTYGGQDYMFSLIWSKELFKYIHIGAAAKPIFSKIDIYKSNSLVFDLGAHFYNPSIGAMVAVAFKNIGTQITPYVEDYYESIEPDLQLGLSFKLKHAPFRFSFLFHTLNKWNMLLVNKNVSEPNNTGLTPEEIEIDYVNEDLENFLRHTIIGVEIIPAKAFYFQVGYNFQQRGELKTINKQALTGVSFGFGITIKKINISYAHTNYHLSQGTNHISISTSLNNFFR